MTEHLVLPRPVRRRSPKEPPVSQWMHDYILRRDKFCFGFRLYGALHVCRDFLGKHAPDDFERLTLGHTKTALAMGKRAPSDAKHLVAECWGFNVKPPNREERQAERAYLEMCEP